MRRKLKIFVTSAVIATIAWAPTHATAGGRGDGHGHKKPADVITGINGPVFGITSTRGGHLLAADASVGVLKFHRGRVSVKASIPGASDVSVAKDGVLWVTTGAGEDPEADTGQGLWRVRHG